MEWEFGDWEPGKNGMGSLKDVREERAGSVILCDKESTKGNWECNLVPFKGFSLLSFLANFPNFKGKSLANEFAGNASHERRIIRHATLLWWRLFYH